MANLSEVGRFELSELNEQAVSDGRAVIFELMFLAAQYIN